MTDTPKSRLDPPQWAKGMASWGGIALVASAIMGGIWGFLGPVGGDVRTAVDQLAMIPGMSTTLNTMNDRVEQIERYMPPFQVVLWDDGAAAQLGTCNETDCWYGLRAARSEFGLLCGSIDLSSLIIEVRSATGAITEIGYTDEFRPVSLTLVSRAFSVPLDISAIVPRGEVEWRSSVEYEHCPGSREPIPRRSPWWPLVVE